MKKMKTKVKMKMKIKKEKEKEDTLTKQDFTKHAQNIEVECLKEKVLLKPRHNDTGSVGWHGSKRCAINIESKRLDTLFNFHITVCKSGEWDEGTEDANHNGKKSHSKSPNEENEDEHEDEHKHNGKNKAYDSWNQDEFLKNAKEIQIQLLTYNVVLKPKINSTNTVGWHSSKKIKITVENKPLQAMINFNITIYKSAQWPKNDSKNHDNGHPDKNSNDDENDNDNDKDNENESDDQNENSNEDENKNVNAKKKDQDEDGDENRDENDSDNDE